MNLMTEEQARKKWCCQPTLTRVEPKCCASECMAWRRIEVPFTGNEVEGFCGLAGPPTVKE